MIDCSFPIHYLPWMKQLPRRAILLIALFAWVATPSSAGWKTHFLQKNIVITGGSSGIGRSLALKLAALGANVTVFARDHDRLSAALDELNEARSRDDQAFEALSVDVRDYDQVQNAAHDYIERHHRVDILINSAGFCYPALLSDLPPDELKGMVETNLLGPIFLARAFMKPLLAQSYGQVVNIASMASFFSFVGIPAYSGAKAGLLAFSRGLKNEFAKTNVSVSVVFPPDTQTPGFDKENETKPVITRKLSANGGVLSPDLVAEEILKGVAARQFQIVPGWGNWVLSAIGQHLPGCAGLFFDWQWRKEP